MALLHMLAGGRLGDAGPASVVAVHVNHHLRGEESDADQALVECLCRELGVELVVDHRPVAKRPGNLQERARELRRAAACEVAARLSLSRVALGHTMDDQVETMLYRLGKYGGLRSLRAMEVRRGPWVRPLLSLRRSDTEAYCLAHGLRFATDRGNQYPGYVRTGIREVVLPAWERVVPGAVEAASRAAGVAVEAVEVLRAEARAFEEACRRGPGVWSVSRLRSVPEDKRRMVLYELLAGCLGVELTRDHVASLESLLVGPPCLAVGVGGGWVAVRSYDALWFASREEHLAESRRPPSEPVELSVPGQVAWGEVVVRAEVGVHFRAPRVAHETFLDADAVGTALWVRSRLPGDRIHPLGAAGSKKVQDILIDARVPKWCRDRAVLVGRNDAILWVAGLASAENARIGRDTRAVVRLSVETDPGEL